MGKILREWAIVAEVARRAAQRITRKIVIDLQQIPAELSGDDSGLKSAWDEICAQVQYEESFYWDAYDQTVRRFIAGRIEELADYEREAIWLQSDAGDAWDFENEQNRDVYPVTDEDIIDYITSNHVYVEAGNWSNARIRAYIDRSSMRD